LAHNKNEAFPANVINVRHKTELVILWDTGRPVSDGRHSR